MIALYIIAGYVILGMLTGTGVAAAVRKYVAKGSDIEKEDVGVSVIAGVIFPVTWLVLVGVLMHQGWKQVFKVKG